MGHIREYTPREMREFLQSIGFSNVSVIYRGGGKRWWTSFLYKMFPRARPEMLLIDEILSVGDHSFQRKCLERIKQFKNEGCTILIVSHDTGQIGEFCDEAIWLKSGRLVVHDRPDVVVDQYITAADAAMNQSVSVGEETTQAPE